MVEAILLTLAGLAAALVLFLGWILVLAWPPKEQRNARRKNVG